MLETAGATAGSNQLINLAACFSTLAQAFSFKCMYIPRYCSCTVAEAECLPRLPVVHHYGRHPKKSLAFPWLPSSPGGSRTSLSRMGWSIPNHAPPGTAACRLPPSDPCSWQSWLQQLPHVHQLSSRSQVFHVTSYFSMYHGGTPYSVLSQVVTV